MPSSDKCAKCPQCHGELERVRNTTSYLNDDQAASQRAGDYFCNKCPDNDRGHSGLCYWWEREVMVNPGSAETGGEKLEQSFSEALTAALYRVYPKHTISVGHVAVEMREWLANFPLRSQNQTVSSGVEGAHKGTTADKSDSREPEKLNNAQPEGACIYCAGKGPLAKLSVALAESSLSHDPNCVCIPCMSRVAGELLQREVSLDPGRCCDNGYFGQPHKCQKSNPESSLSSPPPNVCAGCGKPIYRLVGMGFSGNLWIHTGTERTNCEGSCLPASPELLPTQLPKEK